MASALFSSRSKSYCSQLLAPDRQEKRLFTVVPFFFRALEQTTLPAPESGEIAEIFAFPLWLPSPVLTLRLEGILLVLFSLPNHESRGNPCNVLSVAARKDDEGWRFFLLSGKVMASFGMCSSAKRHVTVIFFPSKTAQVNESDSFRDSDALCGCFFHPHAMLPPTKRSKGVTKEFPASTAEFFFSGCCCIQAFLRF